MLAFVAAERREFDGLLGRAVRVTKLDWPLRFARMAWVNGEPYQIGILTSTGEIVQSDVGGAGVG